MTIQINIAEAKAKLSELVARAEAGGQLGDAWQLGRQALFAGPGRRQRARPPGGS